MNQNFDQKIENSPYNLQHLTRAQAVELAGAELVSQVERLNCEWRSGTDDQEWTAGLRIQSQGYRYVLEAHYYQPASAFIDALGEAIEDLGTLDWVIDHYSLL